MLDDIRPPRPENKSDEEQNKDQFNPTQLPPQPEIERSLEAPHLLSKEEGFVAAKAARKFRRKWTPRLKLEQPTMKQKKMGAVIIAALILTGGTGVYALNKNFQYIPPNEPVVKRATPKPKAIVSPLTGVEVSKELAARPVTGVMIENSPDARPQSGLSSAGIVFEAIAEGGITRFLALFQEGQPKDLGPVRSVRPYYVDLLLPFDASLAHAGGSAEGLAKVRNLGVKDLDHGANASAFRRVSQRYAPHNLYTTMADLDRVSAARGYKKSEFKILPRKKEAPAEKITAKNIAIKMSSPRYNLNYQYDKASNSYKRVLAGLPHIDQATGKQIAPKVVITLSMKYSQNGIYSVYGTTGSGQMYVFQDGLVYQGTWHKAGEKQQFVFKNSQGKPLELNPGQTWITLVKTPGDVTSGP